MAEGLDLGTYSPELIGEPPSEGNVIGLPVAPSGLSASAAPTASAPKKDFNWLENIGMLLGTAGASLQGDYGYVQRYLAQKRQLEQQQQEQEIRRQALKLQQFDSLPKQIEFLKFMRDNIPDDKKDDETIGKIGKMLDEATGGSPLTPYLNDYIKGGSKDLDVLEATHPFVSRLPKPVKLKLIDSFAKNPAQAEVAVSNLAMVEALKAVQSGKDVPADVLSSMKEEDKKRVQDVAGQVITSQLLRRADSNPDFKKLPADELAKIPNYGFVNDDYRAKLRAAGFVGAKTSKMVEAESDEKPGNVGPDREALAQELGAKNFASLTKAQKQEVNIEVKRRQDEQDALKEQRESRLADQFAKSMSMQERRLALEAEQKRRLLPSQQRQLTGDRLAMKMIDDYKKAYEEFIKESQDKPLSDVFRGAIARNKNAQRVADLVVPEGRTPAEIKLAGKYNALIGNLKSLTNEVGTFTDDDARRMLGSFDPSLPRKQVLSNLDSRYESHKRSFNTQLEDLQAMGKDVSKFIERQQAERGDKIQRSTSKSGKPIISKDDGKTWEYEQWPKPLK